MTSEIDKLKHFHIEDYSGIYFTDELNAGEEFLYTTIGIKDDKEVTFLCKYVKNKHIEACPNCVFNNYFCHGLLCNIVVLKVIKDEIEKPVGDLANKINFDLLNTFFNHQHEMTRSSNVNKTTMKNILNDGRDISIAKLVENTSLIIK